MKNCRNPIHLAMALAPATALALIMAPPAATSLEAGPQGRVILAQGKPAPADREEMKERIRRAGEKAQEGRDGKGDQQETQDESAKDKQQADDEEGQRRRRGGGDRQPAARQEQQQEPQEPRRPRRAQPEQTRPEQAPRQVQPQRMEERSGAPRATETPATAQPATPRTTKTPAQPTIPRAAEEAASSDGEKAVIEERRQRREERRKRREAETNSQPPARQQAVPGAAPRRAPAEAVEQKEIEKLAPAGRESVRREGGAEIRSQSFRTDDGRRIEKRIRTRDDGDKVITTRTTTRDGRTVERERVIDRASDNEVERMVVTLGRLLTDREPRFGDRGYRDRWHGDRDRRFRGQDRDRDRDFDLRIVVRAPIGMRIPLHRYVVESYYAPPELIYETLTADPVVEVDRRYSVDDVLRSERVRNWMPRVDLDTITFPTNEARVADSQLGQLDRIAEAMRRAIDRNAGEKFLLEGHTDAPGSFAYNLELSEARALSVKYALMDAYGIPEENLVTEGYGEEFLKVPTDGAERLNRRVAVRRITPLVGSR